MVVYNNILAGASGATSGAVGDYEISRSLRFNSGDSAHLSRTPSSAGNQKTFTFSCWVKRVKDAADPVNLFAAGGNRFRIAFGVGTTAYLQVYDYNGSSFNFNKGSAASYRDFSAWYHVVVAIDTTDSTADDRVKMYINGSRITDLSTGTNINPSQNLDTYVNSTSNEHYIGYLGDNTNYLDAYLADVHFIDGQALAASDFGEYDTNNVWQPKAYAGTYGWFNNSQNWASYMSESSTSGNLFDGDLTTFYGPSGNTITFIPTNAITVSTKLEIWYKSASASRDFEVNDSGTTIATGTSANGKWVDLNFTGSLTKISGTNGWNVAAIRIDGKILVTPGTSLSDNSFHLDFADPADLGDDNSGNGNDWTPHNLVGSTGLETANQGMDVVTYSGTNSAQNITSLNFQPDFIWFKARSYTGSHALVDSVRGISKQLQSNTTNAESTNSTGAGPQSFNSNGFSLGTESSATGSTNGSGQTYVAWCWKAGGAASSNTDGTITSSVSANNTYGFSICTYTGTGSNGTFGHGLNSVPKFIIVKSRSDAQNWAVQHASEGATKYSYLQSTNGFSTTGASAFWNDTAPTNSVVNVGTDNDTNGNTKTYVAYCWSEIPGFSKFGSYTGNGSSDGPEVNCGFKPRWVVVKSATSNGHWDIMDSERSPTNPQQNTLRLDSNTAEFSDTSATYGIMWNATDTGFKLVRGSSTHDVNQTGVTYIFAAFAEKPDPSVIDSLIDTPTNITADSGNNPGNYATLNPLDSSLGSNLTNGNLDAAGSSSWSAGHVRGTIGMTSGKYYWEVTRTGGSGGNAFIGFGNKAYSLTESFGSTPANSWLFNFGNGTEIVQPNGAGSGYFSGSGMGNGDTVGIALDMDNQTAVFYKNGTAGASISLSSTKTASTDNITELFPIVGVYNANVSFNAGQRPFSQTVPTGYSSLSTANLPDPTIADGSTAMDVALWTGTGATRSITGLGLSPDLVWIKKRSGTTAHNLFDIVRGANKPLFSNLTNAELSDGRLTAFNSDGFTLDSDNSVNDNNQTHVGWAWDAGSSTVSNTDGSITSSVRANPSAGFSIVSYTGTGTAGTIGHGLNAAPSLVIAKSRSATGRWAVYSSATGAGNKLYLDGTDASAGSSNWNNTAPTSSVFSVGSSVETNTNAVTSVAYCFAPVEGYSAFGSYTGNGSADGPFVYTGFKPKWLLIKKYDSGANNWYILDTERDTYNAAVNDLYADIANVENSFTGATFDILSNGFKVRTTEGSLNGSGSSVLYAAFAEHPLKHSRAR